MPMIIQVRCASDPQGTNLGGDIKYYCAHVEVEFRTGKFTGAGRVWCQGSCPSTCMRLPNPRRKSQAVNFLWIILWRKVQGLRPITEANAMRMKVR